MFNFFRKILIPLILIKISFLEASSIEELFKYLMIKEEFAYTLFGNKPMSIAYFYKGIDVEDIKNPLKCEYLKL